MTKLGVAGRSIRLATHEETPGLRALRAAEADHGLDRWPRCCMRRDLPS
ncbi:hypothetical protein [Nocardia sp. N2S4-5]